MNLSLLCLCRESSGPNINWLVPSVMYICQGIHQVIIASSHLAQPALFCVPVRVCLSCAYIVLLTLSAMVWQVLVVGSGDYLANDGGISRCEQVVGKATALTQTRIMFVPTLFWVDEGYKNLKSVNSQVNNFIMKCYSFCEHTVRHQQVAPRIVSTAGPVQFAACIKLKASCICPPLDAFCLVPLLTSLAFLAGQCVILLCRPAKCGWRRDTVSVPRGDTERH